MQISTILWPTDLSEPSLAAADHVRELSARFQARVVLLYVAADAGSYFPAFGPPPEPEQTTHNIRLNAWEREESHRRLENLCSERLDNCPGIQIQVAQGGPAEKILETAARLPAQLIVMAAHGGGRARSDDAVLGGVADRVLRSSPVPVYLVKG